MNASARAARLLTGRHDDFFARSDRTLGWLPTCRCRSSLFSADPIACTVLDPFAGAFTTGVVALELGRSFIGIELNREYISLGQNRLDGLIYSRELLAEVGPEAEIAG